ncbi:hypothetical protein [Ottowia sp. oral taxon 894]|uniref:hypothetical protein n=1 Tax=Ottowia sp. oral taxon 894 TaxID=1658672 RepID=UPI0012E1CE88|nr:hypothetical protein [Ottowia sp. oral taxon 894]
MKTPPFTAAFPVSACAACRPDETHEFLYIHSQPADGACSCQIISKMLMADFFSSPPVKGPFSLGQCIGGAAR